MYPINKIPISYELNGWCGSNFICFLIKGGKYMYLQQSKNYQTVLNHVAFYLKSLNFLFKYASSISLINSTADIPMVVVSMVES